MSDITLYGITEEMQALEAILEQDQGEISDDSQELIEQVETMLMNKVDDCVGFIEKQKDLVKLAKERKKQLDDFIKTTNNKVDRFNDYVKICLEKTGKKEFNGKLKNLKLRKPSKQVNILDETKIPIEFVTIEHVKKINKADIKKAMKDGPIDGVELVDGKTSVVIGGIK